MGGIHEPHDGLFKLVFSDTEHARAELLSVLPSRLTAAMDLDTLEHRPGSFIDDEFRRAFTDLLFSVSVRGEDSLVYFLPAAFGRNPTEPEGRGAPPARRETCRVLLDTCSVEQRSWR